MNDEVTWCKWCGNKFQHCTCEKPLVSDRANKLVKLAKNVLKEFQPYHEAISKTGSAEWFVTEYDRLWHVMNALRDYLENRGIDVKSPHITQA